MKINNYTLFSIDGKEAKGVPACWFQINPTQVIMVIGIDDVKYGGIKNIRDNEHQTYHPAGRLSDQPEPLFSDLLKWLEKDEWDFKICSDPEVFVLEAKKDHPCA